MRDLGDFLPKKSKHCPDNWKIAAIHIIVKRQKTSRNLHKFLSKKPTESFFLELSLINFQRRKTL